MSEKLCACGCGLPCRPDKTYCKGHWSRTPAARELYKSRRSRPVANPSGLCMCGCGQPTPLAKTNRPERGYYAGEHVRYLPGHAERQRRGPRASHWRGGRYMHKGGYIYVYMPDHPAANRDGYMYEHRLVMERALGRFLEPKERVHHINHDKTDNRPENLMLFSSHSEHMKEHGAPQFLRYIAEHPEIYREAGKLGAQVRWAKREADQS